MYNANNYGYNPYGRYMPQQPIEQFNNMQVGGQVSGQVKTSLQGKQVESISVAMNSDIPFDGSLNFFPILDGSAIVTKQLTTDGTIKTLVYNLSDKNDVKPTYITPDDLTKAIKDIDLSDIDDLKDEIKELKQEIKDLKKKSKGD